MNEKPLVSIVFLLHDFFHLANLTLKSIVEQTQTSYEIIVIETSEKKRDLIMLKPYLDKIKIIQHFEEDDLPRMMNKGGELAKGNYVHFIFSGDIYISKYVLAYLKELVEEKSFPNLICCAYLRRAELMPPEVINFSFDYFKKGKIPMNIQSCWFLADTIKKLEGFDVRYKIQAGFDMICKIFLRKNKRVIFSNRVLTDYQLKKRPSTTRLYMAWENIKIIYKNFGLVKTLFWWAIYDHFRMLKLFMLSIKKAFWNP
jgi:hypothetical protein